jgi:hypothetical protein
VSDEKTTALQQVQPRFQGFVLSTFEQVDAMAKRLAESDLLPKALKGRPADVAIILLTGIEFGLQPMAAIRGINVIEGKASMSADLLSGLVQQKVHVCEYFRMVTCTDTMATFETKRHGHSEAVKLSYTIEQAQRAGLTGKDNWKKHPADMLAARCISRLSKRVYPDITQGCYVPDEEDEIREGRGGSSNGGTVIDVSAVQGPFSTGSEELDEKAQGIVDRINALFVKEEIKALVPEIRTLPKECQRRIKPVYDARIHGIEVGEIVDPEPDPFADQPPLKESEQIDGRS